MESIVTQVNEKLINQNEFPSFSAGDTITGALITADSAGYVYTGVQAQYKLGVLNFTPSFTPGLYFEGDGKDPVAQIS